MRKINEAGLDLIKEFEGCKLNAYNDIVGVLTIGYGHTGSDVCDDLEITQADAEELLKHDLERFEEGVEKLCKTVTLSDNQFAALVCFSFNLGLGNLKGSTLYKMILAKDYRNAAEQFKRWNKADGKEVPGLTRRREAEKQLFLKT